MTDLTTVFKRVILPVILLTLILNMLVITGCNKAPWDYPNVDWYSENPVIELHTEYSGEPSIGYMEIDGEQTAVYLWWGPPTYTFTIHAYDSENGISVETDKLLLLGKVKYDKNSATLIISEDYIFENKYSSIVLKRKPRATELLSVAL